MIDDARLCGQVALGGADFSLRDERDDGAAIATIRAAADAGIRIFDSARAYATVDDPFHNERLFAAALAGRDDVLIATKGGHWRAGITQWAVDNSPDRLRRDVEDSLRALGVDRLGLDYVHRADAEGVPLGESVGALDELRREGKVARIGVSNVTRSQLDDLEDPALIVAVQNRFGVGATHRRDVIDWCEKNGVAFFAYSPLGGADLGHARASVLPRTAAIAAARGVSLERLVIRGLLSLSPAMSVVVGARRAATAVDSAAAPAEDWDREVGDAFGADLGPEAGVRKRKRRLVTH